ncbi:Cyclin-A2 [Mortierella sp. 14UC]|nr:Cyclin-A2 [Mortierella sp. 14UC]
MDMRISSTSEATQLSTPPTSSASSTPSPSNTPFRPNIALATQTRSTGFCTPPPQTARNSGPGAQVFYNELLPVSSQSSLVSVTSRAGTETPKRKATDPLHGRPRSQTMQARSQSMFTPSNSRLSLQQTPRQTLGENGSLTSRSVRSGNQQDRDQEFRLPQPLDSEDRDTSTADCNALETDSGSPPCEDSNDPIESGSNKRPKSESRVVINRGNRTSNSGSNFIPPKLSRHSTGSILCDLNISADDDDVDELPKTPIVSTPADFAVWEDKEQTPVKKSSPRRAPLTDISLTIGTPTMPAVIFDAKPLAPLMTRKPRKAIQRSRLVVVSPFPNSHHYWDEYANDTFKYLLEIESRYDRYMYFEPQSDFGDYRSTLVQWIIELCYGYFRLPTGTLHAAVNILDRYLAVVTPETVHREILQCVGMCALMIAGKLEEPAGTLGTFNLCQLCDLYSTRELANTEINILKALKFEILVASATGFSDYFKRAIAQNEETWLLTDAMWISLCATGKDWSEDLAILTGYTRHDMTPCSIVFQKLLFSATEPLDLVNTLGLKYPIEDTMTSLSTVLMP